MNRQSLMNLIRTAALGALASIPGLCCSYSASVPTIAASGGVVPVYVNTQPGCSWQVTHSAGWLSNYSAMTGYGPGVVYLLAAADRGAARSDAIHVEVVGGATQSIGTRSSTVAIVIVATATAVQY